jgi:hypothetical protein
MKAAIMAAVTHKKAERKYNGKKTACGKKVTPEQNSYRWEQVTCKKCLAEAP